MDLPVLTFLSSLLTALVVFLLLFRLRPRNEGHKLEELLGKLRQLERGIRDEFRQNREESKAEARTNREELSKAIQEFRRETTDVVRLLSSQNTEALDKLGNKIEERLRLLAEGTEKSFNKFSQSSVNQLERIEDLLDKKLQTLLLQAKEDSKLMREGTSKSLKDFQESFDMNVRSFNDLQREKFGHLEAKQSELVQSTEKKLESIRVTVEEKLEKTLSERLGQSFETVGKQLIEVQKGLGEMQTIASDVGGLKKVLSNVKLRGGIGEVQLAMLLEQILAPSQYDANVRTKVGSSDTVEFAIRLPGKSEDENTFVYLPIDAKFPKDSYEHLLAAYENAIPEEIDTATKNLEATIRKMARDIRDKYIDPPHTTDFAILFLPFESIYAEVIRRSSLVDQLRDEFKITVAGPTTLVAILNSLQMGFRTLALQKRSSEVWKVLGGVKSEFEKFGGLLEKAQKNIQTGLGQLDDVVGTRTRAIQRKLRNVESLPAADDEHKGLISDLESDWALNEHDN